nr:immunoglobulin light chain junction region [Mus musculus]NSL98839.1 immunoglobulin light chain junction region [Mus musculus]NSM00132.1 immunoglobulin light chain junction region [Mus musculus]
CHQYLSLFTF